MIENDIFIVRCYTKSELAELYFPGLNKKMGTKKLKRWIDRCTPLAEALQEGRLAGEPVRKEFTPKEVKLIIRHLGEPFEL